MLRICFHIPILYDYHDFASVIMKLFTRGGKYCSTSAERSEACVLQYFPPQVSNFIITEAKVMIILLFLSIS